MVYAVKGKPKAKPAAKAKPKTKAKPKSKAKAKPITKIIVPMIPMILMIFTSTSFLSLFIYSMIQLIVKKSIIFCD